MNDIMEFREMIQSLARLNKRMYEFWQKADIASLTKELKEEDAVLLQQLILALIEVLPLFEILLHLDPKRAKDILLRRYVGTGIDPDTKFGGYEFELSSMLDDYQKILGETKFEELFTDPGFDRDKLSDPRMKRSLMEVLNFNTERDVDKWIKQLQS